MNKKQFLIMLLAFLCFAIFPSVAHGTAITTCSLGKDVYYPGQTGFINVTLYNDKDSRIRIAELTATIDYHYTDKVVYEQTFFTNATLPIEVEPGESRTLYVPFSLPTNVAPGFTDLYVWAKNELWNSHSASWSGAEYPTYRPMLYIESPYKPQFQELQTTNNITTIIMYSLGVMMIVFAVIAVSLMLTGRKTSLVTPPAT